MKHSTNRISTAIAAILFGLGLFIASGKATAAGTWSTGLAPIPTARQFPASGVIAGQLYVVGGNAIGGSPSTTALEVYDPGSDTWDTTKAPAPTPRIVAAGAAINGKLYVAGCWSPGGYVGDIRSGNQQLDRRGLHADG